VGSPSWFERRVLNGIRKRFARFASYPSVVHHAGGTFVLDPSNWIDNRIIAGISYEKEQLQRAAELVTLHDLDMFIDIGANFGLYTVLIGKMERVLDVLAIEPMSRNYNQLLANVFANRLDTKVRTRKCAIAEQAGQATLFVDPKSTGLSRLDLGQVTRDPNVFHLREEVEIVRFDDAFPLKGRRPLVKIDVEGHARKVLSTMTELLVNNFAVLQIELFDLERKDATDFLSSLNYHKIGQIDSDYYFLNSSTL
jgi:FkbM family methyltransferase